MSDRLSKTEITERRRDLLEFYSLLDMLEKNIGDAQLAACSGRTGWPKSDIYFFRGFGESRSDTGDGLRIVRVGTHALKTQARTTLWTRLSQHKDQPTSGGNHRGSIFRLLVGAALICCGEHHFSAWGIGDTAKKDAGDGECAMECEVAKVIGEMPFLWLPLDDQAGPESLRGYIERKVTVKDAIAELPHARNGEDRQSMPCHPSRTLILKRNKFLPLMRSGAPSGVILDQVTSRRADYVVERYWEIPPGQNWRAISGRQTNYTAEGRAHSKICRRRSWNEPPFTIGHYSKSMIVYPSQNRGLSLRDAPRLQSFPDWFRSSESRSGTRGGLVHMQQLLANAVCSLVATAVANCLLEV
jgi:hypothetical protein